MSDLSVVDSASTGDGQLRVGIDDQGWQVVAHLTGEADMAAVGRLHEAIGLYLMPGQRLVLDLSGLTFMDTWCLGVLQRAHSTLTDNGGKLILRNPSRTAHRLLAAAGVEEQFAIEIG